MFFVLKLCMSKPQEKTESNPEFSDFWYFDQRIFDM